MPGAASMRDPEWLVPRWAQSHKCIPCTRNPLRTQIELLTLLPLDLPRWRLQDVGGFWRMLPTPRESARSAAFSKCPARGKRCSPIGCRLGCVSTSSSSPPPLPDGVTCMPRVSSKQWVDHSSYQGGLLSCRAAGEGILGTVGSVFSAGKRSPAGWW